MGVVFGMELKWDKPVLTLFREVIPKGEGKPFAVVQATELSLKKEEKGYSGVVKDFYVIMGDVDHISTDEGRKQRYIVCWQDYAAEDFKKGFRKLVGVTFADGLVLSVDMTGKETYMCKFTTKGGKIT